jgi:tetratricopeptide (TPR) repeat protein
LSERHGRSIVIRQGGTREYKVVMPSLWSTHGRPLPAVAIVVLVVATGCNSASSISPSPAFPPRSPSAAPFSPSPSAPPIATPGATSPTQAEIGRLLAAVAANPDDATSQVDLGFALLQRIRETADPSLYAPAQAAFEAARALTPDDALVYVGIGGLQLGKHRFADALDTGRKAAALSPTLASARAVVVDALVELGRYDEADEAAGEMLALRSDLTTLARVSYLAELRGKLGVALGGMRLAAKAPGLAPENTAFADALLGNLLVYSGDPSAAADEYRAALTLVPNHGPSIAGQGRLAVGAGKLDEAIALFQRAADIVPLPEYVIALGDAQTAAGKTDDAKHSYALARAEIQLFQATGVIVDLDLALFEADHGDPSRALQLAEVAYKATPTVRAADALAWAFHRLGRDSEAGKLSDEALRLGSIDPILRYHAGAIQAALGDARNARRNLQLALATDPGFSATGAAEARRLLASLGG